MIHLIKLFLPKLLLLKPVAAGRATDLFKLSDSQNISWDRSFARGKLSTATSTSHTYLFNTKTSEYFRCQVSMAVRTRQERGDPRANRQSLHPEAARRLFDLGRR